MSAFALSCLFAVGLLVSAKAVGGAVAPPAAVVGDADFAAALYGRVAGGTKTNAFLSPASVRIALAMTATGAAGATATQMSDALSLPPGPVDQMAAAFKAAIASPTPGVQLAVANGLWLQEGTRFRPSFVDRLTDAFAASAKSVDFRSAPDEARHQVNQWVDHETNHRIAQLLGPGSVTTATRLVLANAVYFKADWQQPFTAGMTRPKPFHLGASRDVDVPMMWHATSVMPVCQDNRVDAVELPYGGGTTAMVIVIPRAVDGLADVEKELTGETLKRWIGDLRPAEANLQLPRFKTTGSYDLRDPLVAMGMSDAFDTRRADFSGMIDPATDPERVCISGVVHQSFVAVDETGTEAAAATGVRVGAMAMRAGPVVRLVADRPFLYLIRDTRTGTILFIGRCADPRTAG